eukprot:7324758-Prorocentrum_lima.AAC.1
MSMGTMSDATVDSAETTEVRMEDYEGVPLRPLHLRALQWLCSIIAIQTNKVVGTTHFQSSHGGRGR